MSAESAAAAADESDVRERRPLVTLSGLQRGVLHSPISGSGSAAARADDDLRGV